MLLKRLFVLGLFVVVWSREEAKDQERCILEVQRKWNDPKEYYHCDDDSALSNEACESPDTVHCCQRLVSCRDVNWCNGGKPACRNRYSTPTCTNCPPGKKGDRCLDPFPFQLPTICTIKYLHFSNDDTFDIGLHDCSMSNSATDEQTIGELENCVTFIQKVTYERHGSDDGQGFVNVGTKQATVNTEPSYDTQSAHADQQDQGDTKTSGTASVHQLVMTFFAVSFSMSFARLYFNESPCNKA